MTTVSTAPRGVAIHECAHAGTHVVMNKRLAEPETILIRVSIAAAADSGSCRYRWRGHLDPRRHAIRCLSGYVAETTYLYGSRWFPVDGQLTDVPAIVPDVQMARDAVAGLDWPEKEILQAWEDAQDLVQEHWATLIRVAGVLQARLSLTGAEFEAEWRGRGD